jgi:hypothetical protein
MNSRRRISVLQGLAGKRTAIPDALEPVSMSPYVQVSDAGDGELPARRCGRRLKAPRHEIVVGGAPAVPQALWGFDVSRA